MLPRPVSGLSIAGDNGAHQVVSGPVSDIERIVERFDSEGVRTRRLNTAKAFHSALVEPALDELESFLDSVSVGSPSITVVSNLTGSAVEPGMALDGAYWRRHAREAVAFASGVKSMAEEGVDLVIEMGPHSVLGPMATLAWPDSAGGPPRRWRAFDVRPEARQRLILRRVSSMRLRRRTKRVWRFRSRGCTGARVGVEYLCRVIRFSGSVTG